jgi:hypothetical protein
LPARLLAAARIALMKRSSRLTIAAEGSADLRDLLYESGYMGWCDGRIFPTTPLSQMHKWAMAQDGAG